MHAILKYTYVEDYLERRSKFRSAHLAKAWEAVENGALLLGGTVGDEPRSALLIFTGQAPVEAARAFAETDPYVTNGLVVTWTVDPWTTVVGGDAATPIRP